MRWGFISYFMNTLLTAAIIIAASTELAHRCLCRLLLEKLYLCFAFRVQLMRATQTGWGDKCSENKWTRLRRKFVMKILDKSAKKRKVQYIYLRPDRKNRAIIIIKDYEIPFCIEHYRYCKHRWTCRLNIKVEMHTHGSCVCKPA